MTSRFAWIVAVTLGLLGGGFVFHFPGSYGEASQDHGWDGLVTGLLWSTATAAIGLPDVLRQRQRVEWARG